MPFKSKEQMRFIAAAEKNGQVKPGTFQHWADATKREGGKGAFKKLPEKKKSGGKGCR